MGFNLTKGWRGLTDNPIIRGAKDLGRGAKNLGGDALDVGRDAVRDVPVLGPALGQESSAQQAANEQTEALKSAQAFQEKMYGEAKGNLMPYSDLGGMWMNQLSEGIQSGQFLPEEFSYQSQQPQFDYSGQIQDFSYNGQPVDRSISSYMEEDPSLAWQQEQMERAIDRQGAAQGRWGGGATAREMMRETSGLLSQDYANRFARAQAERGAAVGAEQERYGRGLTSYGLGRQAEQDRYGRSESAYNRQLAQDQTAYNRYADQYSQNQQRLQNQLAQYQGLANLGPQMATVLANAAMGQGSALSDLAIQQGIVQSAAKMADSNQLGRLLELASQGASLYGAM